MQPQLAALYDIVLGIHRFSGLAMLLIALAFVVFSIISRSDAETLEQALPLGDLAMASFALVVFSGAYQLIRLEAAFFQDWIIGALLLGVAYLGVLHGVWRPRARVIAAAGGGSAILIIASIAMVVMIVGAIYLMENGSG